MRSCLNPALLLTLACTALALPAHADDVEDARMGNLALASGCLTCHSIKSGQPGPNGIKPIGPAWQDVAAHYRDDPDAAANLVTTVQRGSSAYAPHWKAKVSGYAMPPNAVAISEADTRRLVGWILGLK